MTAQAPTKVDGELVGGVAFERSPRAVPVNKGTRAYTIALNHQHQKGMNTPHKGLKLAGGDNTSDAHLDTVTKIVNVRLLTFSFLCFI
jgi:hypothetical protein